MTNLNITNLKVTARRLNVELDMSGEAMAKRVTLLNKLDLSLESRTGAFTIVLMNMLNKEYKDLSKQEVVCYGYVGGLLFNRMNHLKEDEVIGNLLVVATEIYIKISKCFTIEMDFDIIKYVVNTITKYHSIRQKEHTRPNLANCVLGKLR